MPLSPRKLKALKEAQILELSVRNNPPDHTANTKKLPRGPYKRREFNNQKSLDIRKYLDKVSRA